MKESKPDKPELHIVNFSGGKDSTAMLLRMLEEGMRIDIILFCDTDMEFPQMYDHIKKVEEYTGCKVTRVNDHPDFEWMLTEKKIMWGVKLKDPSKLKELKGVGWATPHMRWCTREFKDTPRQHFLSKFRKDYKLIEYVGIAADETKRLERKRHTEKSNRVYPLVEWGMSEADCLQYCYDRGFDWGGLYKLFNRVSCWLCPLQPFSELRKLYEHFPELWAELKRLDEKTWNTFRKDWSVWQIEYRFEFEKRWEAQGKKLRTREFFKQLYKELEEEGAKRALEAKT